MAQALAAFGAALSPVLLVAGVLGAVITADQPPAAGTAAAAPSPHGAYVRLSRLQRADGRPLFTGGIAG